MNKFKIAFIGVIAVLTLTGCANRQGLPEDGGAASNFGQSESSAIGAKEAEKAALDHAGINADEATVTKTEYDSAKKEYEIEFTAGNYQYEYDIGAADGSVIEFSKKIIDSSASIPEADPNDNPELTSRDNAQTNPPETDNSTANTDKTPSPVQSSQTEPSAPAETSVITLAEAANEALFHAGVTLYDVTLTKTEFDFDDGRKVYEIEFVSDDYKYEYEIDAVSGAVLSHSREAVSKPAANTSSGGITLEEAKTAALAHANLKPSDVTFTKTKLDRDDGHDEYDIEFVYDGYEYEYEIDAVSGAVLSHSREATSKPDADTSGGGITLEEAKTAALAHAGLNSSDVTFTKTKLDRDAGHDEYEIEFTVGGVEYEYTIDAATGKITDFDIED